MKIAGWSYLSGLRARGIDAVLQFLTRDVIAGLPECSNDTAGLYRYLRRGDVVLVEGHSRVSHFIKYATQSQWTHTALYVGDELLRRGDRLREQIVAAFGVSADHLIVEALLGEGVVVAPLEKYRAHTVRICRPHAIDAADLERVIQAVLADLGKRAVRHPQSSRASGHAAVPDPARALQARASRTVPRSLQRAGSYLLRHDCRRLLLCRVPGSPRTGERVS